MTDIVNGGAFLLLSVYIPGADTTEDPEAWADALVGIINDERETNSGDADSPCGVGGFPAAQWLKPESLRHLKELSERIRKENRPEEAS